jgi:hypothetical protein
MPGPRRTKSQGQAGEVGVAFDEPSGRGWFSWKATNRNQLQKKKLGVIDRE